MKTNLDPLVMMERHNLALNIEKALKINEMENNLLKKTELSQVINFNSEFDERRKRYEALR